MASLSVAYLGPPASYTHQAAAQTFPNSSTTFLPCPTIAAVFATVQNGTADRGVVPFENSTYGAVLATLDLFATSLSDASKRDTRDTGAQKNGTSDKEQVEKEAYTNIEVCGETFVKVRHCLLGKRAPSSSQSDSLQPQSAQSQSQPQPNSTSQSPQHPPKFPPPTLTHITHILSHPQALGQCQHTLSRLLPSATRKEVSSTSAAAEQAAADETGATAAISSEMAAEVYGLQILRGGVQDRDDNETRFMVLRRRDGIGGMKSETESEAEITIQQQNEQGKQGQEQKQKALLIFTVAHHSPGALAAALAVFQRHGLNLASINTRPSGLAPWNYYFVVEVEMGNGFEKRVGDGDEKGSDKLVGCLQELKKVAESVKSLGRWVVASR